jgi:hypothetical protein
MSIPVEEWNPFLQQYRLLLNRNPDMTLAMYTGVKMCRNRTLYEEAAKFSQDLINEFRESYPKAYVFAVRNYRLSNNCEDARKIGMQSRGLESIQKQIQKELSDCTSRR